MPTPKAASWPSIATRAMCLAVLATALSSCTQTLSGCPPLVAYSRDFQRGARAEFDRLKPGSRLAVLVTDYGKMRDACRATARVR